MKRILLIVAGFLAFRLAAEAVVLLWNANAAGDGVVQYKVYSSPTTNGTFVAVAAIGSGTTATVTQATPIAFYVVTAVNISGLESPPSNMVGYTNRPLAPTGLRITGP